MLSKLENNSYISIVTTENAVTPEYLKITCHCKCNVRLQLVPADKTRCPVIPDVRVTSQRVSIHTGFYRQTRY